MREYINRNHVAPRRNSLFRKTIFAIPLNYIDVQRQLKTNIDVSHEATIDVYWNTEGDKSLSEPWIGVTRFELLNENEPGGHIWPEEWSNMSKNHSVKS